MVKLVKCGIVRSSFVTHVLYINLYSPRRQQQDQQADRQT